MTKVTVQNKFQKKIGYKPKQKDIKILYSGIIESCYNDILANEIMKFAIKGAFHECVGFTCAVNHLLLRKAGMQSKLAKVASLDEGTLQEQMNQVYDTYIKQYSELEVNLSYSQRGYLVAKWTNISSRQAVRELLKARIEIARIAFSSLETEVREKLISKFLYNTLQKNESSTDKEVMKRLDAQALETLDFASRDRSDATTAKAT